MLGLVSPAHAARKAHAIARLVSREGKPVGTVDFATVTRGVLITFDLHDLPPGPHAIHLQHTPAIATPKAPSPPPARS